MSTQSTASLPPRADAATRARIRLGRIARPRGRACSARTRTTRELWARARTAARLARYGALAIALGACAATSTPPDDTDLRLQAASHAFGGGFEYLIVHSAGPLADSAFTHLGSIAGPSRPARELAQRLGSARQRAVRLLVTGPDGDKTVRVIRDAFGQLAGERLTSLELLFLGEPRHAEPVRAIVDAAGGRMRFAPFER